MKRAFIFLGLALFIASTGCNNTPKPGNFDKFARTSRGARKLVDYIKNPKNPFDARAEALIKLFEHHKDVFALQALTMSKDRPKLAAKTLDGLLKKYEALCAQKKPNIGELSYYRDMVFKLLVNVPKDKRAPFQKRIAKAVFGPLSYSTPASEVNKWVAPRISLIQLTLLGKAGARGALILIHNAFGVKELAGYLLDLKDPKINEELINQILYLDSKPNVKLPTFYFDIAGDIPSIKSLKFLLDKASNEDYDDEYRNYAFNAATDLLTKKIASKDLKGVIKRLKKFLFSTDPDDRWAGAYYITLLEGAKAIPLVMKGLKDDGVYPESTGDAPDKSMVDFCKDVIFPKGKPIKGAWNAIKMLLKSRNKVHKALGIVCVKASMDPSKISLVKPFVKSRIKLDDVFGWEDFTLGDLAKNCIDGLKLIAQIDKDLAAGKITKKQAEYKKLAAVAFLAKTGDEYIKAVNEIFKQTWKSVSKQLKDKSKKNKNKK